MGLGAYGPGRLHSRDWPQGGGGLSTSQPPVLCSGTMVSWEGGLALPSPHLLGPHPKPPPEGHFSGSFSFPGQEEGEGNGQAVEGLLRILEQQACSSVEASVELVIFSSPFPVCCREGQDARTVGPHPGEGLALVSHHACSVSTWQVSSKKALLVHRAEAFL